MHVRVCAGVFLWCFGVCFSMCIINISCGGGGGISMRASPLCIVHVHVVGEPSMCACLVPTGHG